MESRRLKIEANYCDKDWLSRLDDDDMPINYLPCSLRYALTDGLVVEHCPTTHHWVAMSSTCCRTSLFNHCLTSDPWHSTTVYHLCSPFNHGLLLVLCIQPVYFWYSLFNQGHPLVLGVQPSSTSGPWHSIMVYHWHSAFKHVYFWYSAFNYSLHLCLMFNHRLPLVLGIQPRSTYDTCCSTNI